MGSDDASRGYDVCSTNHEFQPRSAPHSMLVEAYSTHIFDPDRKFPLPDNGVQFGNLQNSCYNRLQAGCIKMIFEQAASEVWRSFCGYNTSTAL